MANFVDRALARRLESAEEMPQVHHALTHEKKHPEMGPAVEEQRHREKLSH